MLIFLLSQDDMGWTPLMIAASVKDSEKLVEYLLSKGADVNEKSKSFESLATADMIWNTS